LNCFFAGVDQPEPDASPSVLTNEQTTFEARFNHLHISSFPHLLSILVPPDPDFIPEKISILVIDDLSDIVLTGLPHNEKYNEPTTNGLSRDDVIAKSTAKRRSALLSALSSSLARLAAAQNTAVVVLNKTSSYRKLGIKGPVLRPALNVQQWNDNIATRIAVCRDFWPATDWAAMD
jgi:hypothetical protein